MTVHLRGLALVVVLGCGGAPSGTSGPTPRPAAPAPSQAAPALQPAVPSRTGSVAGAPLTADERAAREALVGIVRRYGRDPGHGWLLGHSLLALGLDAQLDDGRRIVDHVFATWAEVEEVGGVPLIGFPKQAGGQPVEPHSELFLQKLVDLGAPPDLPVHVGGRVFTLADLWRGALWRSWIDGTASAFPSPNDTPWALQGIAAWAPAGAAWTATGGHRMTLDAFTHAVVADLVAETAFLADARARSEGFQKRGQGIFAYTCGGAHLLQGAAYAVARGFGAPEDRDAVIAQAGLQAWRFPIELAQVDLGIEKAPAYAVRLATQRLKFTGHHLETMTRFVALGLVPADDPVVAASIVAGRSEVVRSVQILDRLGVLANPEALRAEQLQAFLDLVGDGAHAVHALDLASGAATVRY